MFIKPCEGRVTSRFRTKERPDHHGVDIAQAGTVEVRAVAAGRVTRSYVSESYGEVIFILHDSEDQEYETVYAHLRGGTRRYGVGSRVPQGAVIGLMGNTGRSFGQHLHFELHKGRWNMAKSNAIDPLPYITKEREESGLVVKGYIDIVGVKSAAYICDQPDSANSRNVGTASLGSRLPIAGSIPGWWEVIYQGKRAYVNEKYGRKVRFTD